MTDLPTRMREAAETLIEANYRFTGCTPAMADQMAKDEWSADKLHRWADKWALEDADRNRLAERLSAVVQEHQERLAAFFGTVGPLPNPYRILNILADYDIKERDA